jgi:single-stranded-DNA-specific exonuclease
LAGRLKDKFHRPVIAFAKINENELKASARSVAGLNIRDVLAAIDKDYPGMIIKLGAHAMAAGMSMHPDNFKKFKQVFVEEVEKQIDLSECTSDILTDGSLDAKDLSLQLAAILNEAGPWGQHFPEPVFDDRFEILDQRLVGERHLKLTLAHEQGGEPIDAIAFNIDLKQWPNHRAGKIHAAYKLDINEYAGRTKLQLMIVALQTSS